MKDDAREQLSGSLFASTSAFVQPLDVPYPVEVVRPVPLESKVGASEKEAWTQLLTLLEEIEESCTDDAVPLLHEALELARAHA